ncbi:MAG: GWxTD domain-containing protein [bacterium]
MSRNRIIRALVLTLVIHVALTNAASGKVYPAAAPAIGSSADADSLITEQVYLAQLQAADATTFKREFESYFLLLLEPEHKSAYDSLQSLDEKKAFIEHYWKAANPNPLLPENDWLLEFNRRVRYARKHFRRVSPPFVDDRGLYYIKFGKPKIRYEDMGRPGIAAYEVWSYESVQRNFVLYFVKEGVGYREIEDLTDIVVQGKPKYEAGKLWLWSSLVKKVRHVSPVLGEAAAKIEFLEEAIAYAKTHPNARSVFAEELNAPHGIIATIDTDVKVEKHKARIAAPSSARDPLVAKNELEFFDQIAQFRGPRGKTRAEEIICEIKPPSPVKPEPKKRK